VWAWIQSKILDEDALAIGLRQYQQRAEAAQAETRRQLELLEQQRVQIRG